VVEGGSIGQSALVDEDMAGIGFEKSLNRVRPKTGSTSEYFQHYMTMARESGYVAMQCVGATFMHLTSEKLGRMIMPFPPEHEQRQIASNIEQHLLRLENASSKGRKLIDLLRERRSALVSAAVTGKINVTNEGVAA
jgi:type I restriction enzyme S subunit